ncbi:MAG: cell division protein FtsL [Acidibrevibacterium sp.]|uniref:cell division protein FtsL n=1 Tax=Acidibrevibacterium sp. TaxID=2606776 RepID=UPI003D048096
MIRPLTSITLLLFAGAGIYLYHVKHRTLLLDRQIAATLRETEGLRAKKEMLQAEWALLNQPDRLADFAARHLALKPLAPVQFVPLAELDRHLPAVVLSSAAPDGEVAYGTDGDVAPAIASAPSASVPPASVPSGGIAAETRPQPVAALAPPLPAALAHDGATRPAPLHKPAPAPAGETAAPALRVAANATSHRPTPPAIAPRPVAVSVVRPVAAFIAPPHAAAAPQSAAAVPVTRSALGGPHVALPPPVPPQSRADGP